MLLSFRAPAHVQLRRHTLRGGGVALHVGGGAAFGGLHQNSYLGQRETSSCFARPGCSGNLILNTSSLRWPSGFQNVPGISF